MVDVRDGGLIHVETRFPGIAGLVILEVEGSPILASTSSRELFCYPRTIDRNSEIADVCCTLSEMTFPTILETAWENSMHGIGAHNVILAQLVQFPRNGQKKL